MTSQPSVSVIVPTYKEAESLPQLIARLDALRPAIGDMELIIVDDDSCDGTADVIESLGYDWIRLIVRVDERGLSSAVLAGLTASQGELLVVMDADLSHPPEAIPQFLTALRGGAQFALGSRYIKGGSTEDGWGVLRWVNSKIATWMARPFTKVGDPMSGFFAIKRSTWAKSLDLDPVGYKIGLELIVKCECNTVVEVPIHFSTRRHGHSKLSLRVQLEYVQHIVRLMRWKYPKWASFLPFAAVGASGMLIYVGLLAILGLIVPWMAVWGQAVIAAVVAIAWNFGLDRWLAFWYARSGSVAKQFLGFLLICSVPVALNIWITVWLAADAVVTPLAGLLGSLAGSAAGLLFNWFMSRWLVFKARF